MLVIFFSNSKYVRIYIKFLEIISKPEVAEYGLNKCWKYLAALSVFYTINLAADITSR